MTPDQAKELVAGSLGEEMQRFPLRFCKPVFFGEPPSREHASVVRNGTVSLVERNGEHLAITCWHVIDFYRQTLSENRGCFFAIANSHFDPLKQIVAEDPAIDLCVIRLTPAQAASIKDQSTGIGEAFYALGPWPPAPVEVGEFVTFGGFPGALRRLEAIDEISFGTYSNGAARVTDSHSDYLTCQFEREFWIKHARAHEKEPSSLGGLSGGPAFAIRHSPLGIISYDFCGVVYKMHESSESLYIRQAHAIPLGIG